MYWNSADGPSRVFTVYKKRNGALIRGTTLPGDLFPPAGLKQNTPPKAPAAAVNNLCPFTGRGWVATFSLSRCANYLKAENHSLHTRTVFLQPVCLPHILFLSFEGKQFPYVSVQVTGIFSIQLQVMSSQSCLKQASVLGIESQLQEEEFGRRGVSSGYGPLFRFTAIICKTWLHLITTMSPRREHCCSRLADKEAETRGGG